MPCYSPLQAFQSKKPKANGKSRIVFSVESGVKFRYEAIQLPCGQCIGCRLERSRQWAVRCVHEASLYSQNCFLTLTFNDDHLPNPPTLDVRDFQLFMKRLRKRFGKGIRFFHCGEYGEKFGRPHYHCIIFNLDFPDKVLWKEYNGTKLYRSKILEELWPYGYSSIGAVTFESAAYVARYILKKVNGDLAESHYSSCPKTGEVFTRKPEYTTMSRRPGIAKKWFDKYCADVFPSDEVILRDGVRMRPPKYYDSQYEIVSPDDLARVKSERKRKALKYSSDNTPARLKVREQCQLSKMSLLPRIID